MLLNQAHSRAANKFTANKFKAHVFSRLNCQVTWIEVGGHLMVHKVRFD